LRKCDFEPLHELRHFWARVTSFCVRFLCWRFPILPSKPAENINFPLFSWRILWFLSVRLRNSLPGSQITLRPFQRAQLSSLGSARFASISEFPPIHRHNLHPIIVLSVLSFTPYLLSGYSSDFATGTLRGEITPRRHNASRSHFVPPLTNTRGAFVSLWKTKFSASACERRDKTAMPIRHVFCQFMEGRTGGVELIRNIQARREPEVQRGGRTGMSRHRNVRTI
jgi:hypothetical protein